MATPGGRVRAPIGHWLVPAIIVSVAARSPASAAEPVRELARNGAALTLGNPRLRLTIEPAGTIRNVRVGDTQLVSFIALYTNPTSPELGKDVRGCQAETPGLGDRPPEMNVSFAEGTAQVVITRVCSHPQVLGNAPLWRLRETISLSPDGVLQLRYACAFDQLVRWQGFSLATALTMDAVRGQALQAFMPGFTFTGTVPEALPARDDLYGLMGARVGTTTGPLTAWFGGASRVDVLNWTQYLTFMANPLAMPHAGLTTYRDTHADLSVEMHLPVN